jgi:uncharacterized protein (UPF0262 family)
MVFGPPVHTSKARLVAIEIDGAGERGHPLLAAEREAAIRDLVAADNLFRPAGRERGRFRLRLSLAERRLVLAVSDRFDDPVARHILSLTPLDRVIRDYFLICESYAAALATAPAARIEAIDMGRRGIHNEGAETLRARLAGKIELDQDTARRLFTVICALRWKG